MTVPSGGRPTIDSLAETIELQRLGCELAGSPLYAEVLDAVALDVASGGPSASVLAPYAGSPFGDAIVLRFLAAVHHTVLAGQAPELAAHYPSMGGNPGHDVAGAFLQAVEQHRRQIIEQMAWGVQTNEVGRSVVLLGGYQHLVGLGLPLRVREIGSSAGLNLGFDRYCYRSGSTTLGPLDSPVRFDEPWLGSARPDLGAMAVVASRRGCDIDPIDPTTEAGVLRLRSLIWPDQTERRRRLDAAIEVARTDPVAVERADAVDWLAAQLAQPVAGELTVVVHSIVLQYLPTDHRRRLLELIEQAGRRATPDAPMAWLRMEPGGDRAETRVTQWPGAMTELLSSSSYHGPPVAWSASRPSRR